MTEIEALKLLKNNEERIGIYRYVLKNLAINALKKQIPKKIIHFQYDDGRINYCCPICKRKIISKIDDKWCAGEFQIFCDRCGQKLDWSDTD